MDEIRMAVFGKILEVGTHFTKEGTNGKPPALPDAVWIVE